MQDIPEGVSFEKNADGFVIRASCRSFVDSILQAGRAGLLTSLPLGALSVISGTTSKAVRATGSGPAFSCSGLRMAGTR